MAAKGCVLHKKEKKIPLIWKQFKINYNFTAFESENSCKV